MNSLTPIHKSCIDPCYDLIVSINNKRNDYYKEAVWMKRNEKRYSWLGRFLRADYSNKTKEQAIRELEKDLRYDKRMWPNCLPLYVSFSSKEMDTAQRLISMKEHCRGEDVYFNY